MSKSDKPPAEELPTSIKELLSEAASENVSAQDEETKSAAYRTAQVASSMLRIFEDLLDFSLYAFPDKDTFLEDEFEDRLSATLPTALKNRAVSMALDVEADSDDEFQARRKWPEYIILALAEKHGLEDADIIYIAPPELTRTYAEVQAEFACEMIEVFQPLAHKLATDLSQEFNIPHAIPRILLLAIAQSDLSPDKDYATWPPDIKTWLPETYQSVLEQRFESADLGYCTGGPLLIN